ncbi:MAG: ATP-binding protein [Pseudomonadota bacterium]
MFRLIKFLPLAAFLFFCGIGLLLWRNQNLHRRELILRQTESSSEQIAIRIEGMMTARMVALELLADRWTERVPPDFSKKRFLEFAESFYTRYPGFAAINWVDPGGVIRWVFPREGNRATVDGSIREYTVARQGETVSDPRTDLPYIVTPCAELTQGGLGFNIIWPLIHAEALQGYLNGVFQVKRIMDICLAQSILADYCIRIYEADRLIFTNETSGSQNAKNDSVNAIREIRFPGKVWKLELIPTADIYGAGAIWNFPLLFFNLSVALSLSLLLYFLLQRMLLYRQARDHALHEVGERQLAEKALKENEKKLETLLAELAAKNEELEAFVFTVSHDLKTPVVTIEGFLGAFREDFGDHIPADGQEYLNYISDAARKIELLINDLLELSRIGRVSETRTTFPFADLIEEALHSLQHQIKQKEIKVTVDKNLPLVHGEKKRLLHVVENLLSNAVKYIGKENPFPAIAVGGAEREGRPVFFVRDNGIGIDARYFEKIFGIFQRLPGAESAGAGTGVGLTIVKRVVEHHGGSIWLESEPGNGTTFYFTLNDRET